jgi:hypothetical protein
MLWNFWILNTSINIFLLLHVCIVAGNNTHLRWDDNVPVDIILRHHCPCRHLSWDAIFPLDIYPGTSLSQQIFTYQLLKHSLYLHFFFTLKQFLLANSRHQHKNLIIPSFVAFVFALVSTRQKGEMKSDASLFWCWHHKAVVFNRGYAKTS